MQIALEENKKSFKLWQRTKNEEDRKICKVKEREAKRQVAQARRRWRRRRKRRRRRRKRRREMTILLKTQVFLINSRT